MITIIITYQQQKFTSSPSEKQLHRSTMKASYYNPHLRFLLGGNL